MHVIFLAMDRLFSLYNCCRWMRYTTLASLVCLGGIALASAEESATADKAASAEDAKPAPARARLIGATTLVTEVTTGLPLAARVDTGATSCSIHCVAFEIKDAHPDAEKVDELFLWVFGRKPTATDRKAALEHIEKQIAKSKDNPAAGRKTAYENILWALVNTKEFWFNQ